MICTLKFCPLQKLASKYLPRNSKLFLTVPVSIFSLVENRHKKVPREFQGPQKVEKAPEIPL